MTQQEWETSNEPAALLARITKPGDSAYPQPVRVSDRKAALFAVACARIWGGRSVSDMRQIEAVEELEDFSPSRLLAIDGLLIGPTSRWAEHWAHRAKNEGHGEQAAALLRSMVNPWRPAKLPVESRVLAGVHGQDLSLRIGEKGQYCPWLTSTVLALAHSAYVERIEEVCGACEGEGGRMLEIAYGTERETCTACHGTGRTCTGRLCRDTLAVLADALENAGCTEEDMLRALRGERRCSVCQGHRSVEQDTGGVTPWGASISTSAPCEECKQTGWTEDPTPRYRGFHVLDTILGKS